MKDHEQIDAFAFALDALINRYTAEFDLPIATIVGVLEDRKLELLLSRTVHFAPDEEFEEHVSEDDDQFGFTSETQDPDKPEQDDEYLF